MYLGNKKRLQKKKEYLKKKNKFRNFLNDSRNFKNIREQKGQKVKLGRFFRRLNKNIKEKVMIGKKLRVLRVIRRV